MTEQEQVDLFSVWLRNAVLRFWLLLLVLGLAGGAIALGYGLLRGPVYATSWMIAIGRIPGLGPLEAAAVASARVDDWLDHETTARECTWRTAHVPEPESTVALSISCHTAEQVTRVSTAAAQVLLAPHQKLFDEWGGKNEEYRHALQQGFDALATNQGTGASGPERQFLQAWLQRELLVETYKAGQQTTGVGTHPSQVVQQSEKPSGPAWLLTVMAALGVVVGLFVGLIVALVRDAWIARLGGRATSGQVGA